MRKTTFLLLLIFIGLIVSIKAQKSSQSNQTKIRLTIVKDNDEILMRKTNFGSTTQAFYYTERQTICEVLYSISDTYGITIYKTYLKELFNCKNDLKSTSDIRQLYVAKYKSGQIKQ